MRTIVVSNAKGGVGKTTTAVTVAEMLSETAKVLVVDTDPQGSATLWTDSGNDGSENSGDAGGTGNFGFDIALETEPAVLGELRRVAGYDYIVVDTQPALRSAGLRAVLAQADYALLPSQPEAMDFPVLMDTLREVVWPMEKPYRVLLTLVDPRTMGEAKAVGRELGEAGVNTFGTIIRQYRAHKRARLEGRPVTRYSGPRAWMAVRDYRKVVEELEKDLGRISDTGGGGGHRGSPDGSPQANEVERG